MSLQAEREFNLANARYQPLVAIFVAMCTGIIVDRLCAIAFSYWIGTAVISLVIWAACFRRLWQQITSLIVLAAVGSVAGAWHHMYWHQYQDDEIALASVAQPTPLCLEAVANSTPRIRAPRRRMTP